MTTKKFKEAYAEAVWMAPGWGQQYINPAFNGDVDAIESLMAACHDYQRPIICHLLYKARVGPEAFRAALDHALTQTHYFSHVERQARGFSGFVRWCRYAEYPLPDGLPDPVTIYRGAQQVSPFDASLGCSWSLSREIAEFFASREKAQGSLIISVRAPLEDVILYTDCRSEQEIILGPSRCRSDYIVLRWVDEKGNDLQKGLELFDRQKLNCGNHR